MHRYLQCVACGLCLLLVTAGAGAASNDLDAVKERMIQRVERLAELKQRQLIGENRLGYLQVLDAAAISADAKALVAQENADRRQVYTAIATQFGTTAEQAGGQRARIIYRNAEKGIMLQGDDGQWSPKP